MISIETALQMLAVGTVWGSTNAFMERGFEVTEKDKASDEDGNWARIKRMFTNIAFVLPLIINWCASIGNNMLLDTTDMTIAVPAVNCITFMTTFVTQRWL